MTVRLIPWLLALALTACGGGGGGGGGGGTTPGGTAPPPQPPTALEMAQAALLLNLATFGPTYTEIEEAAELGPDAWLERQLGLPMSRHIPIIQRYGDLYGYDPAGMPSPVTYRRFAFFEPF